MLNEYKYLIVTFFIETGCDDAKPDDHADIELKIPNDNSNNLCDCEKSCNINNKSIPWGSGAIHITNGNDNNFFFNQHQ